MALSILAIPLLIGSVLGGSVATAAPAAIAYHVDCVAGNDANAGTSPTTPWRTLAKVNSITYAPGDTIKFKAQSRCAGTLAPKGSGTPTAPITVTSYGTGVKPGIDGQGATAAVFLHNVQGWHITNLDITNTGPAPGAAQRRVGIYVLLENFGTGRNYRIQYVNVRNVNGCDCRYPDPTSGGILFHAGGAATPTGFDGVMVANNVVSTVDREGIATSSDWQRRPRNPGGPGTSWVPFTRLHIANNTLQDIGGDGVLVLNGQQAIVEGNNVAGFNKRSADFNVGMITYNSDNTYFQFNDVSGGKGFGMAFGLDGANDGGFFQYNLSRDNEGGFLSICSQDGEMTQNGVIRYNISQNDTALAEFLGVISISCAGADFTQIYNNTFYSPNAPRMLLNTSPRKASITNNIFYGRSLGSEIRDTLSTYSHNLYHRIVARPANDPAPQVGDPWLVAPGVAKGSWDCLGYELTGGSRALGTGLFIANHGGRDFFGNVPSQVDSNIGAYEGLGVTDYTNGTDVNIPDYPKAAVTSGITAAGVPGTTADLAVVLVNINHTFPADLTIDLVAPDGTPYRLTDGADSPTEPNMVAMYTVDASAEAPNGTWRLRVQDMFEVDTGFINSWSLSFVLCPDAKRFANTTNVNIPDAPGAAVTSSIAVSTVPAVAGRSAVVGVDIKHAFRGDLLIDLLAPDGTPYRLKEADGDGLPNVYASYIVDVSSEAPNGTWRLQVQDLAAQDTGFIDAWKLTFGHCCGPSGLTGARV